MTRAGWPMTALLAALVALGLALRAFQIGQQILHDDEWHAIIKLATSTYGKIATSLGIADFCIPLTLFFKWVAEKGRLSEAWMLAVPFACGIAAWLYCVWIARRAMAPRALAMFAALLTISPLLVLYTRQARPYAIALLLTLLAVASIYRWTESGRRRDAALYVVCGTFAMYFHLTVAPMVLGAPLVLAVEWAQGTRTDRRRPLILACVVAITAVLIASLVGQAIWNDSELLAMKSRVDHATPESFTRASMMLLGTGSVVVGTIMAALAAVGCAVAGRSFPRATRFAGAIVALQVAGVLMSGALWLSHQLVLARYLLVCLPFVLAAVAFGFDAACARLLPERAEPLAWALAVALAVAGYLTGPLPRALAYPTAFFSHYLYFLDFDPAHNSIHPYLTEGPVPQFYRDLARLPRGSVTLIEGPWRFESSFNRLAYFQQIHRQHVEVAMVGNLCPPGATAEHPRKFPNKFRHFVDIAQPVDALRRSGDYVVFHRSLKLADIWLTEDGRGLASAQGCIDEFRRRLGAPVFEDEIITVFDLRRGGR